MCGIIGTLNLNTDEHTFARALKTLTPRGPDDSGIYYDQDIFLGNTRLSIIDLEHGKQPISNEDGTVITVLNGEIYNYKDLKNTLKQKGHTFKTKCDTEVLVHLYEEYGPNISSHIDGMYAFAIWDKNKRKLFLCRDRFGQKPLVYYLKGNKLIFASEAKAIMKFPSVKQNLQINNKSLIKYLLYGYVPSPASIYENMYRLRPASQIEFSLGNNTIISREDSYWDPQNGTKPYCLKTDEALDQIDYLIKNAVKKRLMADVPVGAFLSGGIDSGVVVSHLSKFKNDLETFTITYNEGDFDESVCAAQTAKHLRVKNQQLRLTENDVLNAIDSILSYIDEPMADLSIIPSYFVSRFARSKVKVALSGDGGDELFGGYFKYVAHKIVNRISSLPALPHLLSGLVRPIVNTLIRSPARKQAYSAFLATLKLPIEMRNFLWTGGCFMPDELSQLLKFNISYSLEELFEDAFFHSKNYHGKSNSPQKAFYLDSRIQLPDWYLLKTDWASMANSLEVRNPLLDKDLTEMVFSLPHSLVMRGFKTKGLLKKLASRHLPHNVINQKKRGFGIPVGSWMRNGLRQFTGDHLSGTTLNEYFNKNYIQRLFSNHLEEKADNTQRLWRLTILEHVLRTNKTN